MPYITKANNDDFRNRYSHDFNYSVGVIEHIFGCSLHEVYYWEMENWCAFIDAIFGFPFDLIGDWLISIVRSVYSAVAFERYRRGVDQGRELVGQVNGLITWTQGQIKAKVDEARAYVESNLINPIKSKIDSEITPKLNDATSKISSLYTQINNAVSRVDILGSNVNAMETKVKEFGNSIETQRQKLNEIIEATNKIQSGLSDLRKRVEALESKQEGILSMLPTLKL